MARGKAPPARCKSIDNRYSVETSQTIGRPVVNWKPLRAGVIASNPPPSFSFLPPAPVTGPSLHPFSSGCSIPSVGVAINAPLKEIGNPFVGTFVVVLTERRSSHELRQIQTHAHTHTHSWGFCIPFARELSPRPLFILPRVHSCFSRGRVRSHLHGVSSRSRGAAIRSACFSGYGSKSGDGREKKFENAGWIELRA